MLAALMGIANTEASCEALAVRCVGVCSIHKVVHSILSALRFRNPNRRNVMSEVTVKNFNEYLSTTVKNDATVADRCQNMIVFGREHYAEHGDTRYLGQLMNANFRATRRDGMRAYIVATTNLKCVKHPDNEEELIFKVDDKSVNKTRIIDLPVNKETKEIIPWFVFAKEKIQVAFDIDKRINALIGQAKAALEGKDGKHVVKGTTKHTRQVLSQLQQLAA